MVNIRDKTIQIRNAVYGKDVRESIASGIENISDQQDVYEQNLTSRQNTYENSITKQQNDYEQEVTTRQTNYEASITNRQNDYESNLTSMQNTFEQRLNATENIRMASEDTRVFQEKNRQANEGTRQELYNEFRNFVNTAQQVNRVPYLFDGGDFGDASSPVLTLNGGDF